MEKHELAEINVLVVHKRLLDFDLLLRISGNKVLGSVCITHIGQMKFKETVPICVTLQVQGSDFHIDFDKQHTMWTVVWK